MNSTKERDQQDVSDSPRQSKSAVSMKQKSEPGNENQFPSQQPARKSSLFVFAATVLILGGAGLIGWMGGWFEKAGPRGQPPTLKPIPSQYDPDRVMGYMLRLCEFGPRPSGSPAMKAQQDYLQEFFVQRGANVSFQRLETRHPETGSPVPLANLIASWGPDRPKRFLLCAHYDTRPYPDQDRDNPKGVFIGANDGASGTAALMEMSHQFASLPADIGVDVVLFDAEEFVWQQGRDEYFLGSGFFAENYKANPPAVPYQSGVLLDMIGDRELRIYYEQNSLRYARDVTRSIWKTAQRLGVQAFVPRARHTISDDHIPLNQIAKIPTTDLIDFDYPRPGIGAPSYWHTEKDIPENCSGESMAAVVWVVHQWILSQ
ncbi:Peptidase family M28 [Rubripirellula obstinata]|uniref:Peptidase family M28 n=2 Tax=Rubripirellula obstinata TaxID=406547 RepID=A0A5B1CGV7_9BACT|nr:Peptidase family M28 [Rubripirellula obstinata]